MHGVSFDSAKKCRSAFGNDAVPTYFPKRRHGQANIPTRADRLYLGWLFRILQSPKTFLPRYASLAVARKIVLLNANPAIAARFSDASIQAQTLKVW